LEAEVVQYNAGESDQQPSSRLLGRILVAVAIFFPFIFGLALNAYVTVFPHVIRYMDGKHLISASLLMSVALTFITTHKYLRFGAAKILIRLPIVIIYLVVAYLLTIRSYCDPYWYGEEYDDGSGSSSCIDEKPSKSTVEKTTEENKPNKAARPDR
jgi:energy-converting hydrogenase Eha subunit C